MNELEIVQGHNGALTTLRAITAELYGRYIAFIDAKPKTIETYTRALKQFFHYITIKGIT
jgi:integrase/recombinase XerD